MESQVSPKNIEARVEAMAASANPKPIETPAAEAPKVEAPKVEAPKVEAPAVEAPKVEAPKVEAPKVEAPKVEAPKVEAPKVPEKKQPNDPAELRKWSTKLSQENAQLREKMDRMEAAINKLSKKPIDYAAIAKDPESLKAHIEQERAEAVADLQKQLQATKNESVHNETVIEKMKRESDIENYPRWKQLFPIMQTLAANGDGRVNWNQKPGDALDEAYALAAQLSPVEVPAVAAPAPVVPTPAAPAITEEQIQARVDAAVAKAKADTEANLRAEMNGAGIGSGGRGGRRDGSAANDALKTMPLKDLGKMIGK